MICKTESRFGQKRANKAFSERNPKTVKNTPFFENSPLFSHILSKQGGVLSYKMIACDLLGCTGRWGFCRIFEHFSDFEFFLLPNRVHARPKSANANR